MKSVESTIASNAKFITLFLEMHFCRLQAALLLINSPVLLNEEIRK